MPKKKNRNLFKKKKKLKNRKELLEIKMHDNQKTFSRKIQRKR